MPAESIYLDHNATTPIDPRVVEAMTRAWRDCGANPASQHAPGRAARRMLEEAREGILELLGAKTGGLDADQLLFTSGGTEANNLALFGPYGGAALVSVAEHPSLMAAARQRWRPGTTVGEDPDVALMLHVAGGSSAEAFEELVLRYQARVLSVMERLAGNKTRGEELAQEVFLAIFKRRERYHPTGAFQNWLFDQVNQVAAASLGFNPSSANTIPVGRDGVVRYGAIALGEWNPISVQLANNETGVIQPVAEIAVLCRERGSLVHSDAVQAIGKIPVRFRDLGVDAMTVAPHKFHGPLGIGGLVLKHGVKLQPQLFGGFQQGGQRPGTENVALAVGFHEALKLAVIELPTRVARMQQLRDGWERELKEYGRQECLPHVIIGEGSPRLPNTSCVSFPGLNRQALVMALDLAGVACSTGSACASGSSEPSPTLVAMGLPKEVVEGAIRISLGAFTTAEEVNEASRRIIKTVKHLRSQKSG